MKKLSMGQFVALLNSKQEMDSNEDIIVLDDCIIPDDVEKLPNCNIIFEKSVMVKRGKLKEFHGTVNKEAFFIDCPNLKKLGEDSIFEGGLNLTNTGIEVLNCKSNKPVKIVRCYNINNISSSLVISSDNEKVISKEGLIAKHVKQIKTNDDGIKQDLFKFNRPVANYIEKGVSLNLPFLRDFEFDTETPVEHVVVSTVGVELEGKGIVERNMFLSDEFGNILGEAENEIARDRADKPLEDLFTQIGCNLERSYIQKLAKKIISKSSSYSVER